MAHGLGTVASTNQAGVLAVANNVNA